jgi:uncharacterized Tic20 family protein
MGALSHAAVALSGPGILVGVVIWLTQKEKSAYASGQGLQAAVYQLLGMILFIGLWIAWGIFYGVSMVPMVLNPEQFEDAPPPLFWIALGSMVIPMVLMVIWGLYGLWGALRCWRGAEFRYAILGKRLLAG